MNSVIWSIDQLIASGSFSWLPCLLDFLSSSWSACLLRVVVQKGEAAFPPASLPVNSLWACDVTKINGEEPHSQLLWGCNRVKREVCFCSCSLQKWLPVNNESFCFLHFCCFQSVLVSKWQGQLCRLGWTWLPCWPVLSVRAAAPSFFYRMPGQLILGAKMKRMLEWLTFSSRHRYDFQVQDFLI